MPYVQYGALAMIVVSMFLPIELEDSVRIGWLFLILSLVGFSLRYALLPGTCPVCKKQDQFSNINLLVSLAGLIICYAVVDYLLSVDGNFIIISILRGVALACLWGLFHFMCGCSQGVISILDRKTPPVGRAGIILLRFALLSVFLNAFDRDLDALVICTIAYVITLVACAPRFSPTPDHEPTMEEYREFLDKHPWATMVGARKKIAQQQKQAT
ncbi:MAG: hypothetical protein Q3976_10375 [Corynebacterium sp.]|nr:hypothetical protein [Corynebacterium sp.]